MTSQVVLTVERCATVRTFVQLVVPVDGHMSFQPIVRLETHIAFRTLVVAFIRMSVQVVSLQGFGRVECRPAQLTHVVPLREVQSQVALEIVAFPARVVTVGAAVGFEIGVVALMANQSLLPGRHKTTQPSSSPTKLSQLFFLMERTCWRGEHRNR